VSGSGCLRIRPRSIRRERAFHGRRPRTPIFHGGEVASWQRGPFLPRRRGGSTPLPGSRSFYDSPRLWCRW